MGSVAIIGCGLIGTEHARCFAILGSAPVFFVDSDPDRAGTLAAEYDAQHSTDPLDAINSDVEAVYICTYHDTHAPLAIATARVGKHIFIEKPMALTSAECQAICNAVREAGVLCMTGFKLHYYSLARKAKELIGQPLALTARVVDRRWPDDSWANDPIRGGGNVLSQGCHAVELLSYFAGARPVRIFAEGGNLHHPGLDIVDTMAATIAYENGAVATLLVGDVGETQHNGKFSFQAMNGKESVHLYRRLTRLSFFNGENEQVLSNEEDGFMNENREFLSVLAEHRKPETNEIDGMRTQLILLAGIESIRSHTPQSLEHLA
jgi:predicted dehydrogenase